MRHAPPFFGVAAAARSSGVCLAADLTYTRIGTGLPTTRDRCDADRQSHRFRCASRDRRTSDLAEAHLFADVARDGDAACLDHWLGLPHLPAAAGPRSRQLCRGRHGISRLVFLPTRRRHPLQHSAWREAVRRRQELLAGRARKRVHLALALAYFISVTYYLTLLAAFLLKGAGITDPLTGKILTTAILAAIGLDGLIQGLHGLENIEEYAVGFKLAVITAVLAALAWLNVRLAAAGTWHPPHLTATIGWTSIRTVLGLLIVVQGFETSRFLAGVYPPELRVRTMRYAQLLSGGIYLAFFLLAMVALNEQEVIDTEVTGIIAVLKPAASALPLLIIAGAVFAQLSAAVADAIGASGLIQQVSAKKIDRRHAYPVIALIGIGLTWTLDIFGVISLASRAFALFYLMQCLVAAAVALKAPGLSRRGLHAAGFLALAAMALAVVLFGIPMQGV